MRWLRGSYMAFRQVVRGWRRDRSILRGWRRDWIDGLPAGGARLAPRLFLTSSPRVCWAAFFSRCEVGA